MTELDMEFSDELLNKLGAWVYGTKIASESLAAEIEEIDIPLYQSFSLTERPEDVIDSLRSSKLNWAIKYSRSGKHFSHSVRRGENSSLGRTIHIGSSSLDFLVCKIGRVFGDAPRHTARVVFQELIDLSVGCLFHAELTQHGLEIEVLFNDYRVLLMTHEGVVVSIEPSSPERFSQLDLDLVSALTEKLEQSRIVLLEKYRCESWAIEGFWDSNNGLLRLLQLRPTPFDRPMPDNPTSTIQHSLYTTRFVWGKCDRIAAVSEREVKGDGVLSLCRSDVEFYDDGVLSRIGAGALDLVLRTDPYRASRLSHEPWFLPPIEYRGNFCHLWLPQEVLIQLAGRNVRLVSNGDLACVFDQNAS